MHLQLVGEAADHLIDGYRSLGLDFDSHLIELGAAVHDAGKILHPGELKGPGAIHERAGQDLLLAHGVDPRVARCCVTHAKWQLSGVTFEERSVALADKLWKGKRDEALELAVIDGVAMRLQVARWDIFERLDAIFEAIASEAESRLERSRCFD
ncbi:HD domain-containing protein [Roseateles sp. P5_E11]